MACSQLHLDRNLSNNAFESWRLAGGPSPVKEVLDLPGCVSRHEPESYDYLSARVAALRNHLRESNGKLWAFVSTAEGDLSLCCFSARGNAYALTDMLGALALCQSSLQCLVNHLQNFVCTATGRVFINSSCSVAETLQLK